MKNNSHFLILLFATAAGVSSYYIDSYNEDPWEKSDDGGTGFNGLEDYRNSYDYEEPMGMTQNVGRNADDYRDYRDESMEKSHYDNIGSVANNADDYEDAYYGGPTGMIAGGNHFERGYQESYEDYGMVVGGNTFIGGINGGCSNMEFRCRTDGKCIHIMYRCDGDVDCSGGEDEQSCSSNPAPEPTQPTTYYIRPPGTPPPPRTTQRSIYRRCSSMEFHCTRDNRCIHLINKCDGIADCSDGQDEQSCRGLPTTTSTTTTTTTTAPPPPPPPPPPPQNRICLVTEFHCRKDAKCIPLSYRCNKYSDCTDGEDEWACGSVLAMLPYRHYATTTPPRPRSSNNECRSYERRCNGHCLGIWTPCN